MKGLLRMSSTSQTQILVCDVVLPNDVGDCHRNMSQHSLTVQVRACIVLDQLVDMYGTNTIVKFLDGAY
jgi:hypothetical protein